jgi:hypothetical protein
MRRSAVFSAVGLGALVILGLQPPKQSSGASRVLRLTAGIELAHRIRKGQFSFGRGRRRHGSSRKAAWAMAVA